MIEKVHYFSGVLSSEYEEYFQTCKQGKSMARCMSYYYIEEARNRGMKWFEFYHKNGQKIMMDSGAFTFQKLWMKGSSNKLKKETEAFFRRYIQFCKQYKDWMTFYVTFDYLFSHENWQHTVDATWEATQRMMSEGLTPMPIFHSVGDMRKTLKRYVDAGVDYFGISHIKGSQKAVSLYGKSLFQFFDEHKLRSHGFGVSRLELILPFPWTSVDSTQWIQIAVFGSVIDIKEKPDRIVKVYISKAAGMGTTDSRTNYWRMDKRDRRHWDELFEMYGTNAEKLSSHAKHRIKFNAQILYDKTQHTNHDMVVRYNKMF